ncbi:MAG TPA: hypothetical protein PLZ16_03055 [Gammaproteobacteria bacterium]|nr:hypothetical protein [Gammaproteobacteria bacterium]
MAENITGGGKWHGPRNAAQVDFSPAAVNRAVITGTLQKPYVLYPAAIGLLGIMGSLLIAPSALFVAPALLGSLIGGTAWLVDNTVRRERHAHDYLRSVHNALVEQLEQTISRLQTEFSQHNFDQGVTQLTKLRKKFQTFRELLKRKLNPDELTYGRYLGITEQVFLAGLDNLQQVSNTLQSISAIDGDSLRERIAFLKRETSPDKLQLRELEALEARMLLFEQQREQMARRLTQNEEAMTRIDQVMAAISSMATGRGHAGMDMESAMAELKELAGRADRYSSPQ